MRFFVKVELDIEKGNEKARDGSLGETIGAIVEEQKPEAAYFLASGGKRSAYLFMELDDASQIPAIAEPWFLAFNASIEASPVMVAEDLMKAGPAIERAVKTYG